MMKNHKKPIQAALFFCVVPLLLATGSCTTQDKNSANIHSWTKDVDSLAKGKVDSRFWSKVRSRSNMVDAYTRLGGFYQKQGKHRKAIAEFIKAIKTKEAGAGVYNSLAMSYDALKEYRFAEMAYKDAIALAPEQPYLYNNYGCSSMLRGDIDAAVALFEKAASLDADSRRIKNNLRLAILRGNKNEILKTGNQETALLPGLYVTDRIVADNTDLKEGAELVRSPIEENIEEPVKDVVITEPVAEAAAEEEVEVEEQISETQPVLGEPDVEEIAAVAVQEEPFVETVAAEEAEVEGQVTETQPSVLVETDIEEIAVVEVEEEPVVEAVAAEEVEVEEQVAEALPVMGESAVIAAEVVERVQVESEPTVEVVETSTDETVVVESTPVQIELDDSHEMTSLAATSSDDDDNWFNDFFSSALATLGFESDEQNVVDEPSATGDEPAVVATEVELLDEETVSVDNNAQVQEKISEEVIVDAVVVENVQQEILTVISEQPEQQAVSEKTEDVISVEPVNLSETVAGADGFEENIAELSKIENIENKSVEREVVETVVESTVVQQETTVETVVDETINVIVETVSTKDDVVAEDVLTAVHAEDTAPDSVDDTAVTAQADESPEVVNEIIVEVKPDNVIQIKALQVAESCKGNIKPKSYTPIAEEVVHTLAASEEKTVADATNTDKRKDVKANQKVAIEVSNGNGVEGMATRSAAYFREQGHNIRRITNAKHFGFKDSIVLYREGYLVEAYKIALMVPGYQEMKQVESLGRPEITVRLLLGKDMAPLKFPESMAGITPQQISNYGQTVTMVGR